MSGPPPVVPPGDLRHARQPNAYIVGICLDCHIEKDADSEEPNEHGVKRFLDETGHCTTCGSGSTIVPNAVREMARQQEDRRRESIRQERRRRKEERRARRVK